MGKAFYHVARIIVKPIVWLLYRVKLEGRENLHYSGKMMLISNHTSMMDTVIIGCIDKHQVHFMAKKELFENKLAAMLFKGLGTFPVDRGKGDIAAVSAAGKVLQEEQTLVIFPEGTRNKHKEWRLAEFQNGAALIALHNDAPVIPICFADRPKLFHKTRVIVGKAVDLKNWMEEGVSRAANIRKISLRLRDTILELKDAKKE